MTRIAKPSLKRQKPAPRTVHRSKALNVRKEDVIAKNVRQVTSELLKIEQRKREAPEKLPPDSPLQPEVESIYTPQLTMWNPLAILATQQFMVAILAIRLMRTTWV